MSRGKVLAVVPARGGSKGIAGKNLRSVGGVPLLRRAVAAIRAAPRVDRVVVSTDADDIAAVARQAGAEVLDRPAPLASDDASTEGVLLHVLDEVEAQGWAPDVLVLVQCTSPFVSPGDVDGVVGRILDHGADSALTVAPSHRFLWSPGADGARGVNHDPARRPRRQELPPEFVETGAAYAMRVAGFRRSRHRFFGRIDLHEVPAWRAIEIDEPDDLLLAEAVGQAFDRAPALAALPRSVGALVLDFDGVVTDDRVLTLEDGTEGVIASRGDGLGIERLRTSGIPVLILSKERNPVVAARAQKLGVPCLQAVDDKLTALEAWAAEHRIPLEQIVYVGNDVNDRECLEAVGCGAVVADAHPGARAVADVVLNRRGGRGAVREIADLITRNAEPGANARVPSEGAD